LTAGVVGADCHMPLSRGSEPTKVLVVEAGVILGPIFLGEGGREALAPEVGVVGGETGEEKDVK